MSSESSVKLIEDWRERWEPVTNNGEAVLAVAQSTNGRLSVFSYNGAYTSALIGETLVPKPRPKTYRPWKREEVPVGAVVRGKYTGYVYLISNVLLESASVASKQLPFNELLEHFVRHDLNPDGTWLPTEQCPKCGVEE